jgi:hypothetical protein
VKAAVWRVTNPHFVVGDVSARGNSASVESLHRKPQSKDDTSGCNLGRERDANSDQELQARKRVRWTMGTKVGTPLRSYFECLGGVRSHSRSCQLLTEEVKMFAIPL